MVIEITAIGVGSSLAVAWLISRVVQLRTKMSKNDEWELVDCWKDMEETLNVPGPGLLQMCRTPAE